MAILDRTSTLEPIREKIEAGERLDFEDGLALLETDDLLGLGDLADRARRLRGGTDEVYFVQNLYLNQTNVCRVKCKFCAFAATQKQEHAYTISTQEMVEDAVRQRELTGFTEIHMVNGENPHVDFEFYVDAVRSLKQALPDVHLKMYTASEIHHMTVLSGLTHEEVLRELKAAGLGSLPGGGAEVFADRVRKLVAPGKEHPDFWFRTHDAAHRLGIPTHCTMLYGHVETYEERVDHFLRLRAQQDETGGFLAFIPLAFHPENTVFERRGWRHTTGSDDLKMLAVSRLMLDNIANIKAYWIMMGMPLAAVALHFGANDVQGTVVREQIFHAAGAVTETEQKIEELVRFVRDAGRIAGSARHALQGAAPMVRLGRISYVNMAPVFHRLNAEVDEVQGVPTELNGLLLDGQLDLAPISSIEYARHASSLRILPRMCVSSEGAVDSIQIVSKIPFASIRSIAVTPESATSVVLSKVLLPNAVQVPLEEEADAKLLIGDAALKSAFEDPTPHYDLGRLWLERTGLPMVFAVWAAPEPVAEGVAELEHSLVASVRLARAEPDVLAFEASERYGYPAGYLARYFEKLRYSFGPRERAGLYTFLEMARDVGELEHVPELRFVGRRDPVQA